MTSPRFRLLAADRAADDLEQEVLAWWRAERLFEQQLEQRRGGTPWIFFDGPPTANGRPGIHHVFARTVKDLFCRHRAMQGHHVPRKAGWDTHGLPVEIEVEKELGIKGKQDIERYGIEAFNRRCRESVWKYRAEWERLCERIAHWMDYEAPYVTYSNEYIESEWWALKTMHERGLLYRGHKILPYCARCGTALSSHELSQGYKAVEDPSVYVTMDLASTGGVRRRLLVWTTTPWTLVSNVALAVHPDLAYVELQKKGVSDWTLILADGRAAAVLGPDYTDRWDVVWQMDGRALAGQRYRRPLDLVPIPSGGGDHEVIVTAEFVTATDGTGIVHLAPAFGVDDYATGQANQLAMLQPVNARGAFEDSVPLVGGKWIKEADPILLDELRRRDALWKAQVILHDYPHCWRCSTPLIYYARESKFVRTTALRDEMVRRNARMDWHPAEIGTGRFGEWLANNVDWTISRERYWGTPLPVWVCDTDGSHREVIGSYAELSSRVGHPLPADFDPHKPYIDRWKWPCDRCPGTMVRVPEVIDAWFDSGSMPFAQWHYPFENREVVEAQFPADFIAEGLDQTRGWFYSLLAISASLGDALPNNTFGPTAGPRETAPYRTVVVNDLVTDANGQKMSKSRGNTVDPFAVLERHGADAVRLFLVASSSLGVSKRFDENVIRETAAGFLVTLKNVYSGIFAQYANYGWTPELDAPAIPDRPPMDRWILARLGSVEADVDRALTDFDATAASRSIMQFVVDDVSNWYVRQCRGRFYETSGDDNRAAFATLHEVLLTTCRLLAPIAPFVSDWIYRELAGVPVHLADYRTVTPYRDAALEAAMGEVRELSRLGRAAREEAAINVRRPLAKAVCVVPESVAAPVRELLPILAGELNIKEVVLASSGDDLVTLEAKANFKALGRRFGKATPLAAQAVQALGSDDLRRFERGEEVLVVVDGAAVALETEDVTVLRRAAGGLLVKEANGRFVALDPIVTPALRNEGIARELVSRVQRMRKEARLAVSDRIRVWIGGDAAIESAVSEYIEWISGEVLATHLSVGGELAPGYAAAHQLELDGLQVSVALIVDG